MTFYVYLISRQNNKISRYMGIFPNRSTVDKWYDFVREQHKLHPGEGKFNLERVAQEWYTLETTNDVESFVVAISENGKELEEYRPKCFWMLVGDYDGSYSNRIMPIISGQQIYYVNLISRQNSKISRYMGIFPDRSTVDKWYDFVREQRKLHPGEGKFNLERVSPEWYTLETTNDVESFVVAISENGKELEEYRPKCFWMRLGDYDGSYSNRIMPIISGQEIR